MHPVEVGRLEENLPARSGQSVAACFDEAADLGSDEMCVFREPYPDAYRHAFNAFELPQRQDRTFARPDVGPILERVTELDIDFVLLELWRMCDGNQCWRPPLGQELARMGTQFKNQLTRRTERRHRTSK